MVEFLTEPLYRNGFSNQRRESGEEAPSSNIQEDQGGLCSRGSSYLHSTPSPAHLLQLLQEDLSHPGGPLKTGDHFLLPLSQADVGGDGVGQTFQGEACREKQRASDLPCLGPVLQALPRGTG